MKSDKTNISEKLPRSFFEKPANVVAKLLLGKSLVRTFPNGTSKSGIITETEAYLGVKDKACHSYGGRRTKRNVVMYSGPGLVYVYFTYGMHWMLNVVTSKINDPQAVLIRGLDVVKGPGRLTKYLEIDKTFYGEDLLVDSRLKIADGKTIAEKDIRTTPRIGIDYAQEWKDKPLRYVLTI